MKKEDFVLEVRKQYVPHMAKSYRDSGLQKLYAKFYEVSGRPGGPVFSGHVVMISNEIDVDKVHKPFFVKQEPKPEPTFSVGKPSAGFSVSRLPSSEETFLQTSQFHIPSTALSQPCRYA